MIIAQKGAGELVSEILMSKQNWRGTFLLVEGDGDSKFWRLWKSADCDLVISTGRPSAIDALCRLDGLGVNGVIGVVDDDQDVILGRRVDCPIVVYTHCADLEICQFQTGALDRVLVEYGDERKLKDFESCGVSVREFILSLAAEMAQVRFLNRAIANPVSLKRFKVRRFVDRDLVIDWRAIEDFVVAEGMYPSVTSFRSAVAAVPNVAGVLLAQGHDLVDLLTLSLEWKFGAGNPGRDRVAAMLRMGVQAAELQAWQTCGEIRKCERSQGASYLAA